MKPTSSHSCKGFTLRSASRSICKRYRSEVYRKSSQNDARSNSFTFFFFFFSGLPFHWVLFFFCLFLLKVSSAYSYSLCCWTNCSDAQLHRYGNQDGCLSSRCIGKFSKSNYSKETLSIPFWFIFSNGEWIWVITLRIKRSSISSCRTILNPERLRQNNINVICCQWRMRFPFCVRFFFHWSSESHDKSACFYRAQVSSQPVGR